MPKNWIQKVNKDIKKRGTKGVFKAAAERHGMTTRRFADAVLANRVSGYTSTLWHRRAGLAKAFLNMRRRR